MTPRASKKKSAAKKNPRTKQPPKSRAALTENRNGEVISTIERLAVLTESEVSLINRGINTTNQIIETLRLVNAGQNAVWERMKEKYDLPEGFNYNPKTGEVTPQEEG